MSPAGGETSNRNAGLTAQLWIWNQQYKLGKVFDSSGEFKLTNGECKDFTLSLFRFSADDIISDENCEQSS